MRIPDRQNYAVLSLLVLAVGIGLFGVSHAATGVPALKTVRGEVVAVTVDKQPQVIVVKTIIAGKQELIVGAMLQPDTVVTRGKKRVALSDIRVGETVSLAYLISSEGPAAKSIHAR